jgi:hypothetical protein
MFYMYMYKLIPGCFTWKCCMHRYVLYSFLLIFMCKTKSGMDIYAHIQSTRRIYIYRHASICSCVRIHTVQVCIFRNVYMIAYWAGCWATAKCGFVRFERDQWHEIARRVRQWCESGTHGNREPRTSANTGMYCYQDMLTYTQLYEAVHMCVYDHAFHTPANVSLCKYP